jgi:hypothetical protein
MTRLILALALLAAPSAALAQEPSCGREEAMSCAEGSIWDTESRTCVPVVG